MHIGVENRYRYNQIPFDSEFDRLFKEFSGGQLRYWHDVGHAEIFSRLRILDHEKDFLQKYKEHLIGMHIHDVEGSRDHLAPGAGDTDMQKLRPYLQPDTLRILEVHKAAIREEIIRGIDYLRALSIA